MTRTLTVIYSAAAFLLGITSGYVAFRSMPTQSHLTATPPQKATQAIVALNGSFRPHGFHRVLPRKPWPAGAANRIVAPAVTPLPTWNYNITASADRGGGTFSGTIVGRSPFDHGKTTTTIPTQIIPLIITIKDSLGTITYDPTAVDPCPDAGGLGLTDVQIITGSPIFTNNPWTMNGVSQGTTQYIDAFQRAEFDSLVGGSNYHLILNPSVLPSQSISFGTGTTRPGHNFTATSFGGNCGTIGVIDINDIDALAQSLISGALAGTVNEGTFPIFLTRNVVFGDSTAQITSSNCCALGYHSAMPTGALQIYSPFSLDTSDVFGGDVSTLAHEMGEAIDDPDTNNLTPVWGNIGQVLGSSQNNFETGDPLSPGFGTPTNTFTVVGANGFTYHMQELAFFSWFFGPPNFGAGGKFSNNGSFSGDAKNVPPGGTN